MRVDTTLCDLRFWGAGLLLAVGCAASEVPSTAAAAVEGAPAAPPTVPPRSSWFGSSAEAPSGQSPQRRFDLKLSAQLVPSEASEDSAADLPPGSDIELDASWELTRVERVGDGSLVLARLVPRQLTIGAPQSAVISPAEYRARVERELQSPLLLKLDAEGKVESIKASPRIMATAFALLRSIPAMAQLGGSSSSGSEWTTTEADTAGRVEVSYRRLQDGQLRKRRVSYLQLDTGQGLRAARPGEYQVQRSEGTIRASSSGALEALTFTEEQRVETDPGLPGFLSRSSWQLALAGAAVVPTPATEVAELADHPWRPLHQQPSARAHEFELDLTKASSYTSACQIVSELDRLDATNAANGDRIKRLKIALTSLLRLAPSQVGDAVLAAKRGGPHTELLLGALASSGVTAAHSAVVEILRTRSLPHKARGQILVALSTSEHPSGALVDGLERLLTDPVLGRQALLGLGSVAYRSQREQPALTRRIVDLLEQRLGAATDARDFKRARTLLEAFGNAGYPGSVALLEPYLNAEQAAVRAAAVIAIRRIEGTEVDALLRHFSASDADMEVRRVAQKTIAERRRRAPAEVSL